MYQGAFGTFRRLDSGSPGQLWVCKLGWWQGVPWDIEAYAKTHPSYPCEPTLQQLYDGSEFEAYRELGACAVGLATRAGHLPNTPPVSLNGALPAPMEPPVPVT